MQTIRHPDGSESVRRVRRGRKSAYDRRDAYKVFLKESRSDAHRNCRLDPPHIKLPPRQLNARRVRPPSHFHFG